MGRGVRNPPSSFPAHPYMPSDEVIDRKVKIVNLTGHPLDLSNGWTFVRLDSDGRARVDSDMRMTERVEVDGDLVLPVLDVNETTIHGLPEPEDGVLYVVSGIVASHVRGRVDVVSPGRVERNGDGSVKSARALIRVVRSNQLKG